LKAHFAVLYDAAMTLAPARPMDDLTARLEVLLRNYAAGSGGCAQLPALDEIIRHFRAEIRTPVAEYGHTAVDAAPDPIPRDGWPLNSLH
jgi:hypothetical protein